MLMELDIFSSGKEYISASRAAQKSGYASDYIGQLCRSGKIAGKLIGRTWYIDYAELVKYKKTRKLGKERAPNRKDVNFLDTAVSSAEDLPNAPAVAVRDVRQINIFPVVAETGEFHLLPPLSKKHRYVEPVLNIRIVREAAALSLAVLIVLTAGFFTLEYTDKNLAMEVRGKVET